MTPLEKQVATQVLKAMTDTIKESPDGAPLGPMYMAFQTRGMTLQTFQHIVDIMIQLGLIEVKNHCAYWVAGRLQ